MVKKLKLLSTLKDQWKLLLSSLGFGLSLLLAALTSTPLGAAAFFVVAGLVYLFNRTSLQLFKSSFWILALFSFGAVDLLEASQLTSDLYFWLTVILSAFSTLSVWLLIDSKRLAHRSNVPVYSSLNTGLVVLVSATVLSYSSGLNLSLLAPILFLAVYLLLYEFFRARGLQGSRIYLSGLAISLLVVQMGYLFRFVSLGMVSVAVILGLFVALSRDLVSAHVKGYLDLRFVMRQFTVFVLLGLVVFAASNI